MRQSLASLAVLLVLTSCGGAAVTEVLIVVDTDLEVPAELDEIRVDVLGPDGSVKRAQGTMASSSDLPRTVAVVWRGGNLGPVQVTVTGLRGGGNRIQRRATFAFIEGQTRILRMDLLASCLQLATPCMVSETCAENGCRSVQIDPDELLPYSPPGRFDGGTDGGNDANVCVPVEEICNGQDDNCDGRVDEGFDLQTDMLHCGSCERACDPNPSHGMSACEAGECVLHCYDGFRDCDTTVPGCEAVLSMPETCGACDRACPPGMPFCQETTSGFDCVLTCTSGMPCGMACVDTTTDISHCGTCGHACADAAHAGATCVDSMCGLACDPDFYECNGTSTDGCESQHTELDNCGACNVSCDRQFANVSCATGSCEIVGCVPPHDDCNPDRLDGCETDLSTDLQHCGDCGTTCPATVPNASAVDCSMGRCMPRCLQGWGDCDGMITTGCERRIDTPSDCGGCNLGCSTGDVCAAGAGGAYQCMGGCPGTMCGPSCVDTTNDPSHCGDCTTMCPTALHSIPGCSASRCTLSCDVGFQDCDTGVPGCESSVNDPATCGGCTPCPVPLNSTPTCIGGACGSVCTAPFEDCVTATPGCESNLSSDVNHCGDCMTTCRMGPTTLAVDCASSTCRILACVAGREDCDMTFSTGCEINLMTDRRNCGRCGNDCGMGRHCCSGTCQSGSC